MAEQWKSCGSCKKPIGYNQNYWVCSVSSCNRARYKLVFCKLSCWDAHVPLMNHRSAWAEERRSPAGPQPSTASTLPRIGGRPSAPLPRRPAPPDPSPAPASTTRRRVIRPQEADEDKEILIVASRLKKYIKDRSDMSTSADALEALSDIVRRECRLAIQEARADGRRTVKARDFRKK